MKNNLNLFFRLLLTLAVLFLSSSAQTTVRDRSSDKTPKSETNDKASEDNLTFRKVFEVVDFSGEGTYEIFPGVDTWTFFGPVRRITVNGNQKIVGVGSAVLGTTSGTSRIAISLCYQKIGESAVIPFVGNNHLIADVDSLRRTFSVSGTAGPPAGKYAVGYCVVNQGRQIIGNNNYVNGWVMVVN
jgi:hypothetical protein